MPEKFQEASYLKYEMALNCLEVKVAEKNESEDQKLARKATALFGSPSVFCRPADDYICRRSIQPNRQQPHFAVALLLARQFRLVG